MILLLVGLLFFFLSCLLIGIGTAPTSRQFPRIIPPARRYWCHACGGHFDGTSAQCPSCLSWDTSPHVKPSRRQRGIAPDGRPLADYLHGIPLDRELIDGYQPPRLDPNRALPSLNRFLVAMGEEPIPDGNVYTLNTSFPSLYEVIEDQNAPTATVKDAPHEASSWEMSL